MNATINWNSVNLFYAVLTAAKASADQLHTCVTELDDHSQAFDCADNLHRELAAASELCGGIGNNESKGWPDSGVSFVGTEGVGSGFPMDTASMLIKKAHCATMMIWSVYVSERKVGGETCPKDTRVKDSLPYAAYAIEGLIEDVMAIADALMFERPKPDSQAVNS